METNEKPLLTTIDPRADYGAKKVSDKVLIILKHPEACRFYTRKAFGILFSALAKKKNVEIDLDQLDTVNVWNLVKDYGNVSYLQFRSVLDGNGTGPVLLSMERAFHRNGIDTNSVFNNENLIELSYDFLTREKSFAASVEKGKDFPTRSF